MKKDQETLLRMNFAIQAAKLYHKTLPQLSHHMIYEFIQLSEKKMIRIDKRLKAKINKAECAFKPNTFEARTLKPQVP